MKTVEDNHEIEVKYMEHYFTHTYFCVLAWKAIRNELLEAKVITESEFSLINHLVAWHDDSKISEEEFGPYAVGLYSESKDDPEIHSQLIEAIKHHKENNIHHHETLANYKGDDWKCYVVELICDYIAMGWEFKNYLFEYYQANKDKINLPPEYKEYLELVMSIIREKCYENVESPMSLELEMKLFNKD